MSKNWSPSDLRGIKHLLHEARAIEEARIARNVADSWCPPYKPGWRFSEDWVSYVQYCAWLSESLRTLGPPIPGLVEVTLRQLADALGKTELAVCRAFNENPKLNPYRLALDEFETPEDRWSPGPSAKDYSDASEGPGRVTVCGSNYDVEEAEDFSPRDAHRKYGDIDWKAAGADDESTLGFDFKSDLVEKMTDAVKAWAGMQPRLPRLRTRPSRSWSRGIWRTAARFTPARPIKQHRFPRFDLSSPPTQRGRAELVFHQSFAKGTNYSGLGSKLAQNSGAIRYDPSFNHCPKRYSRLS